MALELADGPGLDDCVLEMAETKSLTRKQELVALDLGQAPVQCCACGGPQQQWLTYHMLNECDLGPTGCDNCGVPYLFAISNSITRPNALRERKPVNCVASRCCCRRCRRTTISYVECDWRLVGWAVVRSCP